VVVMVRNQNLQLSKHLIYRRFSAFSKYFSIFYVVLTVFLSLLSVCFRIMLHKIMCVLQINFIITMSHMKA
jgi:cell division protein FtsL